MGFTWGFPSQSSIESSCRFCCPASVSKLEHWSGGYGSTTQAGCIRRLERLIDYAHGRKNAVERLRQSKLLLGGRVVSAGITGQARVREDSQPPPAGRVLEAIEKHFKTLPTGSAEFDHFASALFLMENREKLFKELPGIEVALERFEKLFGDLNALLPRP